MLRTTLFGAAAALLFSSAAQAQPPRVHVNQGTQGQLQPVTDWQGPNPSNIKFDVYVPQKVAESPAIVLALHPCGGSGQAYFQQANYQQFSEQKGFIVAYPSATNDSNCWDVSSAKALKHEGGGDPTVLNSMVQHLVRKYKADKQRIFVTGSSSGCMMTNVLMATYPDVFAAGSCYSGVAAGCVAGSPGNSPTSSDRSCANGQVIKSGAEWAAQVRAMFPGYSGGYPRMQTFHGTADNLVYPPNLDEQLKEWSTLLSVGFSGTNENTPQPGYTKIVFGDGSKVVGYKAANVGHTVPVHPDMDMAWFGLN